MSYQYGDGRAVIGGKAYKLRLTLGDLAELDARFRISGPKDLAARVLGMSPADGRTLLDIFLRESSIAELSDADIAALMPELCRVIETAFGDIHA